MTTPGIVEQTLHLPDGMTAGYAPVLEMPVNDRQSKETAVDDAVRRAFARASLWRTPPHWSRRDWLEEAKAIIQSAAASASSNYDAARGVPLRAHLYMRAVAGAWTGYRQEWSYYIHSVFESRGAVEPIAMPFDRVQADETIQHFLGDALNRLAVGDQLLIKQLFWNRTREHRLGAMLKISQQEVSRRKARVLRQLRRLLNGHTSLLLSRLVTVCWALFDSFDLLPVVDLL